MFHIRYQGNTNETVRYPCTGVGINKIWDSNDTKCCYGWRVTGMLTANLKTVPSVPYKVEQTLIIPSCNTSVLTTCPVKIQSTAWEWCWHVRLTGLDHCTGNANEEAGGRGGGQEPGGKSLHLWTQTSSKERKVFNYGNFLIFHLGSFCLGNPREYDFYLEVQCFKYSQEIKSTKSAEC